MVGVKCPKCGKPGRLRERTYVAKKTGEVRVHRWVEHFQWVYVGCCTLTERKEKGHE